MNPSRYPWRWAAKIHRDIMKLSIKTWCIKNGYNWYGQGKNGNEWYDWCYQIPKGNKVMFSSTVKGLKPKVCKTNQDKDFLLFPNIKNSILGDQISSAKFKKLISWVQECLNGNIIEFSLLDNITNSAQQDDALAR